MQETARYFGVNGSPLTEAGTFWGALQEHCAPNRVCTRQSYDEFGRRVRRWERVVQGVPWGSDAAATVQWIYNQPGFYDANQKDFIVAEWRAPRCYGNFKRSHYNGFGQLMAVQVPYQDWQSSVDGCGAGSVGSEIHVYYGYDGLGKPARVSAPILLHRTSWRATTVDWATAAKTQTTYDALGRAHAQHRPQWRADPVLLCRAHGLDRRSRSRRSGSARALAPARWSGQPADRPHLLLERQYLAAGCAGALEL